MSGAPLDPAFERAPLIPVRPVPACAVCGSGEREDFARGYDYELLTCRNAWGFARCRACGHVWLDPRPADEALPVIYPPSYYAYSYESAINPVAVKAKHWLDRRKFDAILRAAPRAPSCYLDIGCGSGRFLRLMESRGVPRARCHGLELDAATAERLRGEGFAAQARRVEEAELAPGSIDLATMFHVIEHVADPGAALRRIAGWLAPGGLLALETPNLDSVDARLFRGGLWGGYHIPRHWHLFTPATLERLLRAAGLEPVGLRFQTGHSFWMYSVHHALLVRGWRRAARLFDPFRGLPFLAAFTALDLARAALGRRTSAMLIVARKA